MSDPILRHPDLLNHDTPDPEDPVRDVDGTADDGPSTPADGGQDPVGSPRQRMWKGLAQTMALTSFGRKRRPSKSSVPGDAILDALPHPVLVVANDDRILYGNPAAEQFFGTGISVLIGSALTEFIRYDSPLMDIIRKCFLHGGSSLNEYDIVIDGPRTGSRLVDAQVAPLPDQGAPAVLLSLIERSMAHKIDRQLTHRGAARSITGMAMALAHEIKNPLSGIRGAAQLLEYNVAEGDRMLTQLICKEADRIVNLIGRMEQFSDGRPIEREPVNIHVVLEHVRRLAQNGFASHVRFIEQYDPSLPPVYGHHDMLVQIFLNLVKNAAEAVPEEGGEITLTTAFQHGLRVQVPGSRDRLDLPLVVTVQDNGQGVPEDIRANLFDPFVTTKPSGTGLGLSLVAKAVNDHGGVIEVDSRPRRTVFKVMLPMYNPKA
ncbi:nitrogen regulation protein NR(II) [Tistrella mobilis]|uniref:two-component system sensor histidine kinase NtrB n=1 Tax=Tistrella mobilis TaxID=171437 RepID=UPI001E5B6C91|nr:ATP-binding protein [Tistrella mobilis]